MPQYSISILFPGKKLHLIYSISTPRLGREGSSSARLSVLSRLMATEPHELLCKRQLEAGSPWQSDTLWEGPCGHPGRPPRWWGSFPPPGTWGQVCHYAYEKVCYAIHRKSGSHRKTNTTEQDSDWGSGNVHVGRGRGDKATLLSARFCCEPTTALKRSLLLPTKQNKKNQNKCTQSNFKMHRTCWYCWYYQYNGPNISEREIFLY